ncbi:MAG: S41 family peptidase [Muribaculaceae bacterium]
MSNPKRLTVWLPVIIGVSVVAGIFIGGIFSGKNYLADSDRKLNTILNLIQQEYVDTVDIDELVENSIPKILTNLDPHSMYISAKELSSVNDELEGSFSGIGISFMVMSDTIRIIEVISGGPSEKVGLLPGDRIVAINDTSCIGIKDEDVKKQLRGVKDTKVKLGIKRSTSKKILTYTVTRGDIPVSTIDAAYMIDKITGYVKLNKFGKKAYQEFLTEMLSLRSQGAERFIIDLRGNGGGLMQPALLIANEFLPENNLIVFTKGREKKNDEQIWSDGMGSFKEEELVVLIDEYTASSSEILAGAIQDNDRGLIIGRRSFGKGLIQQQIPLPDSSAIRLTIARYYTPSGRCIQKDFKRGDENQYSLEVYDRYNHGEIFSKDSIKVDEENVYHTMSGRKVYGGGGIIPDIFVPSDTAGISQYYINVANAGLLQKFAYQYTDINREALSKMSDYTELLRRLPSNDALLWDFVSFAVDNGVAARWYYINQSRDIILTRLKALIARDVFGNEAFYPIYNSKDNNIDAAMKAFKKNKAKFPIMPEDEK